MTIQGRFLASGHTWRFLFSLSSLLTIAAALVTVAMLKSSPKHADVVRPPVWVQNTEDEVPVEHPMDGLGTRMVMRRCFTSPRFWAMALLSMSLAMLSETQSYLPLFITEEQGLTAGQAAMYACVWQAGIAFSTLIVGYYFDRISTRSRSLLVVALGVAMTLGFFTLAFAKRMTLAPLLALISTTAFAVGPLHWILPNLFGMNFGGPKNCATVGCLLATMACLCTMFFHFGAGRLATKFGWPVYMWLLSGIALAATGLVILYVRLTHASASAVHPPTRAGDRTNGTEGCRANTLSTAYGSLSPSGDPVVQPSCSSCGAP